MSDAVDSELSSLDDPQLRDRYVIGPRLGAGASGEVALCHDQRVGREVAVKIGGAVTFLAGTLAIGMFTQVFSPVLVAPTLAATNLIVFSAYAGPRTRLALVSTSLLGMAIPIALEASGVIPPSFVVDHDGIHILPRMVFFEPRITWALLVGGATVAVGVPGLVAGRVRDALVEAQQKLLVHTWHLEALVPAPTERPAPATPRAFDT